MQKLTLLFLLIISLNARAQIGNFYIPSNKSNLQENKLKGNVKYLFTSTWETVIKFGDPVKDKFTEKREWYFNKNGRYEKGTLETNRTEQKILYKFSYNKNDQLEEVKRTFNSKDEYTVKFTYNAAGNITERNEYNKKNNLEEKEKYKYSSDGRLQHITLYKGNGDFDGKKEFSWNSTNLMAEEKVYDEKETHTETTSHEYDQRGNIRSSTQIKKARKPVMTYKDDYTYDAQNNVTKKIVSVNSSTGEYVYEYDNNGNVIKETVRYGNQTSYKPYRTYTYTYDKNGNWLTKLTQFENYEGKEEYILEEREIKYW